ncbi:RVT 3 domain-containing [Abeliophyllum distichum]|uniref:RVT 3 domain-containing n=1 Tax=Abeliophyllum distichum TaxID=126358 RepID=A0ABD1NN74_9LAMI
MLLSKKKNGETLLIYLALSNKAVSSVLIHEDGDVGDGAGILLIRPDVHNLNCALHLEFKASNNTAKYEALLVSLRLVQEMKPRKIQIYSDSQLVVSQVNGTFTAREQSMVAYLKKAKDLLFHFEEFELLQIPRIENGYVDAFSKLSSSNASNLIGPSWLKSLDNCLLMKLCHRTP